jgi:hypothetical protein
MRDGVHRGSFVSTLEEQLEGRVEHLRASPLRAEVSGSLAGDGV